MIHELGIHTICRNIRKRYHLDYNFDDILCKLIYIRLINPSSTLSYHDSGSLFLEHPDFTPRHIEKALKILAKEAGYIEQQLFENISNNHGYDLSKLYYDTTICLYDSYAKESADHVIPMEIYYDAQMMPLCYRINPDHLQSLPESPIEKSFAETVKSDMSYHSLMEEYQQQVQIHSRTGISQTDISHPCLYLC